MAMMPVKMGRYFASMRGKIYAKIGRDWRQFSFADHGLKQRVRNSLKTILPDADDLKINRLLEQRYIMQSLEDLEACWLMHKNIMSWPVSYEGLDYVQELIKIHGRVVFVASHYGSSILGVIHLRTLGVPILGMSSNVVEHELVHPAIGRFYRNKYKGMQPFLNGGKVLDREGNSRKFLNFLKGNGSIVIIGDLPPDPQEEPVVIDFFGKPRGFASGAHRFAKIFKIPLLSFVCEYSNSGFKIKFSSANENPYTFLEQQIKKNPSAWWASDLLELYPVVNDSEK